MKDDGSSGMRRALRAALRGRGWVSPNPLVGAAWTDGARWVAANHAAFGEAHAERRLYDRLPSELRGGDLFLTLEPCAHHGKTPPCADLVLARRPRRVWVAMLDPNPLVSGAGVAALRAARIPVHVGSGAEEAIYVNRAFFSAQLRGRAWIQVKLAASLDARVATAAGESKWITGEEARRDVHRLRSHSDAVVIGSGTALTDDPLLTVRDAKGPEPSKIVIDSGFRTVPEARVWRAWHDAFGGGERQGERRGNYVLESGVWRRRPRLILAGRRGADPRRARRFQERGWEVWLLPAKGGRVSLSALARRAAREGLHHLLVEPGPELSGALLSQGLVDEITLYLAPRVLGGPRGWSGAFAVPRLDAAVAWTTRAVQRLGADLRVDLHTSVVEEWLRCSRD